jgi:hypothetical protein
MIESQIDHEQVKSTNQGYYNRIAERLKSCSSERHRRKVMESATRALDLDQVRLSEEDRVKVGRLLLNVVYERTGLIDVRKQTASNDSKTGNQAMVVMPTEEGLNWMERNHSKAERMFPARMPMVHLGTGQTLGVGVT